MLDYSTDRSDRERGAGVRLGVVESVPLNPVQGADLPLLLQYWRIVVRWKWVIAGIVLASFVIGLIATLLMTPLYTATSTIEISRQQEKIVDVKGIEPESGQVDLEFYQTQYSLLKARSLAESVALELKLADSDNFFQAFGIKPEGSTFFASGAKVRLTPEQRAERLKIAVDTLLSNISITPIRGSRLVNVGFTSPDPALSMRVANAWTARFIESNLNRRFEATSYARKFLEGRLEQLRQRMEESERNLVNYASSQKIINIGSMESGDPNAPKQERPLVAEDLSTLNFALAEATADRVKAESRLSGRGTFSSEALNNAAINSLRQKRGEISAEYSKLLVQFEPDYPEAKALAQQVATLDRAIAREETRVHGALGLSYQEAINRENGLKRRVDELKSDLLDLRRRSIQYNIFQRDVDTNRQLYDGLLQRYKEIGVAGGVGTNNVAIVDEAQLPERPSSPRMLLNIFLSLLLGVGIAAAVTFALEQIDEAIKDPSELTRNIGLPLLGVVPKAVDGDPISILEDRKSPTAEAYLSVQTNLQFSTDHGVPRSFAVTSTRPGEGKSTTSYAMAQSLARTRRSVVLVDCDMRSPSVHHVIGIPNEKGTSNFLAGDDVVQDMLIKIDRLGISVLPAGPQPPNAAELLTGSRLSLLIDVLLQTFDHVIIDSPPVLGLADAPLIGSRVEGLIYAVEAEGPRSSMVRTALARLASANVNVLGAVLTKFESKKAHYGYGYDYGYGYGQKEEGRA